MTLMLKVLLCNFAPICVGKVRNELYIELFANEKGLALFKYKAAT